MTNRLEPKNPDQALDESVVTICIRRSQLEQFAELIGAGLSVEDAVATINYEVEA